MPLPSTIAELRDAERVRALQLLRSLPSLRSTDIKDDDSHCPVCLISFEMLFEDEGIVKSRRDDSRQPSSSSQPEGSIVMCGVVKLNVCGHVFCRRDLAEWIGSFHGSCPTCRQVFFEFTPINETDYESSDGGEYLPDDDELEEDEFYTDDDFIPSSDYLETDMDMEDDDEDEVEVSFTLDDEQTRSEAAGTQGWDSSSVYADPSADELDGEDRMPEFETPSESRLPELDGGVSSENDSSYSTAGGLSTDSTNSGSSDGPIFEVTQADFDEAYAADVSMVSGYTEVEEDVIKNVNPLVGKQQGDSSAGSTEAQIVL